MDAATPGRARRSLGPAQAARRLVWCASGDDVVHGRTREGWSEQAGLLRRLLGIRPRVVTFRQFEAVQLDQASAALERFLADPGSFAVETAEGARLDLSAPPGQGLLALDCRALDAPRPLGVVAIRREDAARLLESVFTLEKDAQVAEVVLGLAARAIRAAA